MGGWIKLSRALNNWRYKRFPEYVALWVHILTNANHKPIKYGNLIINEGEYKTTLTQLSEETGISVQSVRTILKKLVGNELALNSTNKYTIITILKWEQYQGTSIDTNKQLTNNQQTTNKPYILQECKNERIDDDYKYIRERYLEAGYDELIIDRCLNAMARFNLNDEASFQKILEVYENEDIFKKDGYIYKMRKDLN